MGCPGHVQEPAWATWDLLSLSLMGRELCSVSGSTGTGRDPSRWKLSASNDKFDWVVLNDRSSSSYSMPSARNSIGYSTTINNDVEGRDDTAINKRYYKYNGTWIPLL